jgi:putative hydrolase of the HAD superfamily
MGVRPEDAVYVGDIYEIDVLGARAAGMRPVLIDPLGKWTHRDCDRIRALHDLLDLLPERV